ncbi:MAG TPA: hypothetical protein VGX92_05600 [Pyrinomonadaceae bacterium]|jgi:hypothetical protein|nr:hypothetical protein [Pyrinomonadaceae bacterium]
MAKRGRRDDIHETPDVSHIQNPDVAHEVSDVNVRAILQFVVGLLVFAAVVHVLMWYMLKFLEQRQARATPPPAPMALKENERLPPEPRLQVAPGWGVDGGDGQKVDLALKEPTAELKIVRRQWDEVLVRGQKDKSGNVIAIPIEEAKRQLIEKGLPTRPQTDASGAGPSINGGLDVPSYQSSGQRMEKRDQ